MKQDTHTSADKPHILVVDDDSRLRALLTKYLGQEGFRVTAAQSAAEARDCLDYFRFDCLVLDIMMPGESGLDLAKSLREAPVPLLMLSALGEVRHRIEGFEAGALDYLPKPFEPRELVLRLRSILRRGQHAAASDTIRFGPYAFNRTRQELQHGAQEIPLTTAQRQLLGALLGSAGTPVPRQALASLITPASSERSVDVQVARLRKKLDMGKGPSLIRTVRGAGYVIHPDAGSRS